MPKFSNVSEQRVASCDPRLQEILHEAIDAIDFIVLEGHRGKEAQNKAFAEGKSKLMYPRGKHNAFPSRAVDIAPVYYDGSAKIDWNDLAAFGRLMGYIQRIADERGVKLRFGLDWDGDFRTAGKDPGENFLDAPHVELA